jgi:ribosomal protein S18 acetylase RimI-like enzyme
MPSAKKELKIRKAKMTDASRLAELAGQLGYPSTKKQMMTRLKAVLGDKTDICLVAESRGLGVVGWVHVSTTPLLEVERRAEVNGLVVDEAGRSLGLGKALLSAAEDWAKQMKCKSMSVRSNVLRLRAHEFYDKNGYEHYKTQKAFRKKI